MLQHMHLEGIYLPEQIRNDFRAHLLLLCNILQCVAVCCSVL